MTLHEPLWEYCSSLFEHAHENTLGRRRQSGGGTNDHVLAPWVVLAMANQGGMHMRRAEAQAHILKAELTHTCT